MSRGPGMSKAGAKTGSVHGGLPDRIRSTRLHFGWSQAQLAVMLAVPQQAVSAWERGLWEPTSPAMTLLCQIFGVAPVALRTGRGFKPPKTAPGWIVATEEQPPKRSVSLPPPRAGEVWEVGVATGDRRAMTTEEAIELLRKARKDGAGVWIVVEK